MALFDEVDEALIEALHDIQHVEQDEPSALWFQKRDRETGAYVDSFSINSFEYERLSETSKAKDSGAEFVMHVPARLIAKGKLQGHQLVKHGDRIFEIVTFTTPVGADRRWTIWMKPREKDSAIKR